jgi:hypothetical protein
MAYIDSWQLLRAAPNKKMAKANGFSSTSTATAMIQQQANKERTQLGLGAATRDAGCC